jgi:replicative DNA helicase
MDFVMANAEHLLINKIIQKGSVVELLDSGIRPDHFTGDYRNMWLWILDYWRKYSEVPTDRAFLQEFGDFQIYNVEAEPFAALIDEIYHAYKREHIITSIATAMPLLNDNNVEDAYKKLSEGLQKASVETARLRDVDIIQNWEQRLDRYEEMRNTPNGLRGIPTGFTGLDRITAGLRPQQLITFVGEAKKGKSLMTLIMASAAHMHGTSPMYVSFEMSIEEQTARYDALLSGVSHTRILRGDMSQKDMEKLEKALRLQKNMHPFVMTEDTSSLTTVSALTGKVQQYRPSVLFVDGVYLMDDEQGEPKGSPQALTNITRSLKRLAQRFDIPIIINQLIICTANHRPTKASIFHSCSCNRFVV